MTISSREKEVPRRLPTARLYLDDIEEIQKIILKAAEHRPTRPEIDPTYHSIETTFCVTDRICTEIQDVPKMGKQTSSFEMNMNAKDSFMAYFSVDNGGTQWWTSGLTKADTWRAFHAIEAILERRRLWWHRFIPVSSRFLVAIVASYVLIALLIAGSRLVAMRISPTHRESIFLLLFIPLAILTMTLTWRVAHYPGTVILRFSWEQAERREDRNTKIAIAGVSAFIAFLLGVASMALKHKFWP
jgi:hypothetical protein